MIPPLVSYNHVYMKISLEDKAENILLPYFELIDSVVAVNSPSPVFEDEILSVIILERGKLHNLHNAHPVLTFRVGDYLRMSYFYYLLV